MRLPVFPVAPIVAVVVASNLSSASNPPPKVTPIFAVPAPEVVLIKKSKHPLNLDTQRLLYRDDKGNLLLVADLLIDSEDEDFDFCTSDEEEENDAESFFDIQEEWERTEDANVPRGTPPRIPTPRPVQSKKEIGH